MKRVIFTILVTFAIANLKASAADVEVPNVEMVSTLLLSNADLLKGLTIKYSCQVLAEKGADDYNRELNEIRRVHGASIEGALSEKIAEQFPIRADYSVEEISVGDAFFAKIANKWTNSETVQKTEIGERDGIFYEFTVDNQVATVSQNMPERPVLLLSDLLTRGYAIPQGKKYYPPSFTEILQAIPASAVKLNTNADQTISITLELPYKTLPTLTEVREIIFDPAMNGVIKKISVSVATKNSDGKLQKEYDQMIVSCSDYVQLKSGRFFPKSIVVQEFGAVSKSRNVTTLIEKGNSYPPAVSHHIATHVFKVSDVSSDATVDTVSAALSFPKGTLIADSITGTNYRVGDSKATLEAEIKAAGQK